jgi:hypothetical protein
MNRRTPLFILSSLLLCGAWTSCNSDDTDDSTAYLTEDTSASTAVTSFKLQANSKIMENLDSVFFSIDLVKGVIYNADSLPCGTDVRKLLVTVGSPSSASMVEIIMPRLSDGQDTVVNIIDNPSDSINFSMGNVYLRVLAENNTDERIYSLKVNVHKIDADSLQWSNINGCKLPTTLSKPTKHHVAQFTDGSVVALAQNAAGNVTFSTTDDPYYNEWTTTDYTDLLPTGADINSLTASKENYLYMLTNSGALIQSTDRGETWQTVDTGWTNIYGAYTDQIMGVKNGEWYSYPAGLSGAIDAEMPVSGTSQMFTYTSEWALAPQAMIVGGELANGSLTGAAWAFDGTQWMKLTGYSRVLPPARGYTVFPYFTFRIDETTFVASELSAWVAFGGQLADGTLQDDLYTSLDNGVNWKTGSDNLQLPTAITPRYNAQAILATHTYYANASRAVAPITQWDTPYIYLFGGHAKNGSLYNQYWRGVINRLSFKPLQ